MRVSHCIQGGIACVSVVALVQLRFQLTDAGTDQVGTLAASNFTAHQVFSCCNGHINRDGFHFGGSLLFGTSDLVFSEFGAAFQGFGLTCAVTSSTVAIDKRVADGTGFRSASIASR